MFKEKNNPIFTVYLVYFISMVLFAGVRISANLGVFNSLDGIWSSVISTIIIQVFIMVVIPYTLFYFLQKPKRPLKTILHENYVKKVNFKVIIIAIGLGILAFIINIFVSSVFNHILAFFGYNFPVATTGRAGGVSALLLNLLLVAVLPAICEEFMHRGLILGQTKSIGIKRAIIISSLFFALIHFNVAQSSYAFVVGLILGYVTVISGSIIPAIVIHFVNNGLNIYISFASSNNWFGGGFYDELNRLLSSDNYLVSVLSVLSIVALIIAFTTSLMLYLFRETTIRKINVALQDISSQPDVINAGGISTPENKKVLQELINEKSSLNINTTEPSNVFSIMLPKQKDVYTPTLLDNAFYYGSITLGTLATLFTFIWGIL